VKHCGKAIKHYPTPVVSSEMLFSFYTAGHRQGLQVLLEHTGDLPISHFKMKCVTRYKTIKKALINIFVL
jgi:hypothetical protein